MSDYTVSLRLTADGTAAVTEVRQVREEVEGVGGAAQKSAPGMDRLRQSFSSLGEGVATTRKAFGAFEVAQAVVRRDMAGLGMAVAENADEFRGHREEVSQGEKALSVFRRAAAALGITLGTAQIIRYADQWQSLQGQIALVTESQREVAEVTEALYAIANRTGQSLNATADLYTKIARNADSLGASQEQVLAATTAINNALLVSAAPAASAEAALVQLSQAMASGVLRGEELNSVMEQAPRLAQAIADGMGAAVGELRAMGQAGELLADDVFAALINQSQVLSQEAASLGLTVAQSGQQIENALLRLVGRANESAGASAVLSEQLQGVVTLLEEPETENATTKALEVMGAAAYAMGEAVQFVMRNLDILIGGYIATKLAGALLGGVAAFKAFQLSAAGAAAAAGALNIQMGFLSRTAAGMTGAFAFANPLNVVTSLLFAGAAAYLLWTTRATAAQEAASSYQGVLNDLGRTAEDITAKLEAMTEAQRALAELQVVEALQQQRDVMRELSEEVEKTLQTLAMEGATDPLAGVAENATATYEALMQVSQGLVEVGKGERSLSSLVTEFRKTNDVSAEVANSLTRLAAETETAEDRQAQLEARLRFVRGVANEADMALLTMGQTMGSVGDAAAGLSSDLQNLIDRLDPIGAATRKYMSNVAALDKAWADGHISGERYDELMMALATDQEAVAEAARKQAQAQRQAAREAQRAAQQATKASEQRRKELEQVRGALDKTHRATTTYAEQVQVLTEALMRGNLSQEDHARLMERSRQVLMATLSPHREVIRSLEEEMQMLGLSNQERFVRQQLQKAGADLSLEEATAIREAAEALLQAREKALALADAAETNREAWEQASRDIAQVITENIGGGMRDTLEGLLDYFKQWLIRMATAALQRQIMVSVGMQTAGGMTGGGAGDMAGQAGSSLLGQGLSSIGGSLLGSAAIAGGSALVGATALGSAGSAFGSGMMATGSMIGSQGIVGGSLAALGNAGSMLASGNIAAGLGAAMPVLAPLAIAAAIAYFSKDRDPDEEWFNISTGERDPTLRSGESATAEGIGGFGRVSVGRQDFAKDDQERAQAIVQTVTQIDTLLAQTLGPALTEVAREALKGTVHSDYTGGDADQSVGEALEWMVRDRVATVLGTLGEDVAAVFEAIDPEGVENIANWGAAIASVGVAVAESEEEIREAFLGLMEQFEGTGEEARQYGAALGTLAQFLDADPVQAFADAQERANRSLWETYQIHSDGLYDLMGAYDGSLSATQDLALATQERYQLELNLLGQIANVAQGITDSFAATREQIATDLMSEQEKYNYYRERAESAAAALRTATDPSEIARLQQEVNRNATRAWNLLDDDQKALTGEGWQEFLAESEEIAQTRLEGFRSVLEADAKQTRADLKAIMSEAAGTIREGGASIERAAGTFERAASGIPTSIQVDLNAPEYLEVGYAS